MIEVDLDHLGQQRGLGPVEVVDTGSIGNEAILVDKVEKVLNGVLGDLDKGAAGAQQTLEDPVRVPVVGLAEAAAGNDKGAVDREEAVGAVGAVAGGAVVGARQVGPDVNDFADEFVDDGVGDGVEEDGVCCEVFYGNLGELTAGVGEVGVEEVVEGRVVGQGLLKLLEGFLDLRQ